MITAKIERQLPNENGGFDYEEIGTLQFATMPQVGHRLILGELSIYNGLDVVMICHFPINPNLSPGDYGTNMRLEPEVVIIVSRS